VRPPARGKPWREDAEIMVEEGNEGWREGGREGGRDWTLGT
jgi:hypothetical protein